MNEYKYTICVSVLRVDPTTLEFLEAVEDYPVQNYLGESLVLSLKEKESALDSILEQAGLVADRLISERK